LRAEIAQVQEAYAGRRANNPPIRGGEIEEMLQRLRQLDARNFDDSEKEEDGAAVREARKLLNEIQTLLRG
jgi:hypothetical protein